MWFEELHLVMARHGYPEDTWWQFSYRPARDDEGRTVGMLNVTTEMTGKVLVEAALRASEARLRFLGALDEALRSSRNAPAAMLSAAKLLALRLDATRCAYADAEGIAPDLQRLTKPFRSAELAASVVELTSGPKWRKEVAC